MFRDFFNSLGYEETSSVISLGVRFLLVRRRRQPEIRRFGVPRLLTAPNRTSETGSFDVSQLSAAVVADVAPPSTPCRSVVSQRPDGGSSPRRYAGLRARR